jgi:hypothetical protein
MKTVDYDKVIGLLVHFRDSLGDVHEKGVVAKRILDRDSPLEAAADVAARHAARTAEWPQGLADDVKALLFWRCQYAGEAIDRLRNQLPLLPEELLSRWVESLLTEDWHKEGRNWFVDKFAPGFGGKI